MTLLQAACRIARFLEAEGIPYFIIGGLAVHQWGEPRMTRDVDVTIVLSEAELPSFLDKLLSSFTPRIPDAQAFALRHRVALVEVEHSVPVDISLGIPGYEDEAAQRARTVCFPEVGALRFVSPEDLIIHKCVAGRPRDIEDVEGVLIRQRLQVDQDDIRRWLAEFQPLVDTHDPLKRFEQALGQARTGLSDEAPG